MNRVVRPGVQGHFVDDAVAERGSPLGQLRLVLRRYQPGPEQHLSAR